MIIILPEVLGESVATASSGPLEASEPGLDHCEPRVLYPQLLDLALEPLHPQLPSLSGMLTPLQNDHSNQGAWARR